MTMSNCFVPVTRCTGPKSMTTTIWTGEEGFTHKVWLGL